MSDVTRFEPRLVEALSRYGERAPMSVDAAALVQALAAKRPRRAYRLRHGWRWLRAGIATALLAALIGASLLVFAGFLRSDEADKPGLGRLLVWANGWAWVLDRDGSVSAVGEAVIRTSSPCPVLVRDSNIIALEWSDGRASFAALDGSAVADGIGKPRLSFTAWSPDHSKLAVVDHAGELSIHSFGDAARPRVERVEAPGVLGTAWSPEGGRIAVTRRVEDGAAVEIDVIDVATGGRGPGVRLDSTALPQDAYVPSSWAPRGERLLVALPIDDGGLAPRLAAYWHLVLVDLETGESSVLVDRFENIEPWYAWDEWDGSSGSSFSGDGPWPGAAWAPDGSRVAIEAQGFDAQTLTIIDVESAHAAQVPIRESVVRALAWSRDGSRLGYVEDAELVTISADGTELSRRSLSATSRGRYGLRPDVASAPDGEGFLVVLPAPARPLAPVERATPDPVDGVLLQRFPALGDEASTRWALLEYPGDPVRQRQETCLSWETAAQPAAGS